VHIILILLQHDGRCSSSVGLQQEKANAHELWQRIIE